MEEWFATKKKGFALFLAKKLFFYKHYQQAYKKLEAECLVKNIDLELILGLEWNTVERGEILKQQTHVVLDDFYDKDANSKEALDLVIAGRHRNIHLMVLRRNLFQQSEYSKTIDLNVTQIVLFNCPRDFGTSIGRAFHFIESV